MKTLIPCLLAIGQLASAQISAPARDAITSLYTKTLAQIRVAKTKDDIARIQDAMETKDWVSIDPTGRRASLADAQRALESTLTTPPEKRNLPDMQVVWMQESGGKAIVVMWVSFRAALTDTQGKFGEKGKSHTAVVGALCRDTLVLTPKGWRRSSHEKLFPDEPLTIDGAPRFAVPGAGIQGAK